MGTPKANKCAVIASELRLRMPLKGEETLEEAGNLCACSGTVQTCFIELCLRSEIDN